MKKTIGLIIFIAMVNLSACTKDVDEAANDNLAHNSVKDWFNTTFKNSKEWQQNDDSPNKVPDWDKGTYLKKDSLEVFEFPLKEDYAKIIIPKDKSLTNKEVTKILDATLTRLVIIKADTNTMVVRKLYYVPDYNYLLSKGNDLSKVVFGNDENDFTGLLITKSWNDEVFSCLNVKDGKIEGMLVKKDANSNLTARGGFGDLDEVMIWNSYHKPIDYGYSYSSQTYVYSPVYPNNPYGMGSSGGSGGVLSEGNSSATAPPPSCESFNFVSKRGTIWQESAVTNIHFNIVVITPNGYHFSQIIELPTPTLFGAPTNIRVGDTDISAGLAATLSAQALDISIRETVHMYGNKPVSELTVRLYFMERLKYNYPLFIPGGRVNFNAETLSVVPTNYKTNTFGTGNCN